MTAEQVIKALEKEYPKAKYYLNFKSPLQLVMAAILSPQVRDEVVNECTPTLFSKYKTAKDYAEAKIGDIERIVKKVSFAGNKAKYIVNAGKVLVEQFGGRVPSTVEDLVKLPGVGRKTAVAIMANAFDKVEGIPVDTHVIRLSNRLGWVKTKNPDKIERELMQKIPKKYWKKTPWLLKAHGRAVCTSVPKCSKCCVEKYCPKIGVK